ncbi:MAG: hypothetical protein ACI9KE_001080 [Polyangiales bacterium]|jgi:hypothetical protein
MLLRLSLLLSLAAAPLTGCDNSTDPVDAGSRDSTVELDSTTNSNPGDVGSLDTGSSDTGAVDTGAVDTGPLDSGADVPSVDGGPDAGPGNYVAVAGARCTPQTRIGVISVSNTGAGHYAFGTLSSAPPPSIGEPALSGGGCVFHQANNAPCDCSEELVCTHDREECVEAPGLVDLEVVVHAGGESFTVPTMDGGSGPIAAGNIPLSGDTFGMTLTGLGATITVEPTTVPGRISVTDELTGSYDAPESMDLTWTPEDTDAVVYSVTNINHHVREVTFTECAASAPDGALNIPGSMLLPLAVSTGLEFQRVNTVRFAAAELPEGCVEVWFLTQ